MTRDDIWTRLRLLERDRRAKQRELMDEYDRNVYYPAKQQIQADCATNGGHRGGKYHDNGFGWSWFYCNRCGAQYDISGPDGRETNDE